MEIYGIIDVGSNTIRLSIYRCGDDGDIRRLVHRKEMAGLAGYVQDGELTKAGIETASRILNAFKRLLDNLDVGKVYAFATASLRNICNTDQALRSIYKATGIKVDVLSGEKEGMLSFQGAIENCGCSAGLLVDLGGGSTELVKFKGKEDIEATYSVAAGSLSLYRRYVKGLLPTKEECEGMKEYFTELVNEGLEDLHTAPVICGVGGTVRTVSKLINYRLGRPVTHNHFTAEELKDIYRFLRQGDRDSLDLMLRVAPDRIHTTIPGMIALRSVVKTFGCNTVMVSTTGVREGYLYYKLTSEKEAKG